MTSLTSSEAKTHNLASDINGVRERSKGADINQRATVDMAKSTVGRERDEANMLHDIIEKE